MSTDTTPSAGHAGHDDHGAHPTDRQYVIIALILAAVTGLEVALYYIDLGTANNPSLLILAAIKFAMVGMYFMHLKFDNRILRRLFVTGLILAVFCYFLVFFMFRIF